MSRKEKYLKQIYAIFTEYGVKSFTLDELATKIGVTKMTLYNNFKNKETLINNIVTIRENAFKEYISSVDDNKYNAIELLFKVLSFLKDNPHPHSMIFYHSLKISYPLQYNRYMDNFKLQLRDFIEENLKRGIKEGIYVDSINPAAISGYVLAAMDGMFSSSVENNKMLDLNTLHRDMISYHLRGIVNEKGAQILRHEIGD